VTRRLALVEKTGLRLGLQRGESEVPAMGWTVGARRVL